MKFLLYSLILCWFGLSAAAQIYTVKRVTEGIIHVDGKGSSRAWKKANILQDFIYPWDSAAAPATSFFALWDGKWLYCLYRVKDDSVITVVRNNDKMDVGGSDRVEMFLKKDDSMNPYYCMELDADGRRLDYNATYYRKMNYSWSWPADDLIVKASRFKGGYSVEFAISISSLKEFGLLQDGKLQAGLFRAECKGMLNGRSDLRWISWVRPQSDHPDFHTPTAFGTLVLE